MLFHNLIDNTHLKDLINLSWYHDDLTEIVSNQLLTNCVEYKDKPMSVRQSNEGDCEWIERQMNIDRDVDDVWQDDMRKGVF